MENFKKLKQQEETKSFATMFEVAIWISLIPWLCLGLAVLVVVVLSIAEDKRRGGKPAREEAPEWTN